MKRPQPDIGLIVQASFINDMGGVRKFKRLWGTELVNGVEVLTRRQYYYPDNLRSENFEKLFKYLGAYEDVTKDDPEGVDSAWLYLNKNKGSDLVSSIYADFITDNLNQMWWDNADGPRPDDLTLTANIVIESEIGTTRDSIPSTTSLLDPTWPKSQLISSITNNYDALWDTCVITHQNVGVINRGSTTDPVTLVVTPDEDDLSPNDPWLAAIARNALRTDGVDCTIKDVGVGLGRTEAGRLYHTYTVEIEIPYIAFTDASPIVGLISAAMGQTYTRTTGTRMSYPNDYWTKQAIISMDSSDLETDPTLITRPYRLFEDEAVENDSRFTSIWYTYEGISYLKADVFVRPRDYGLTFRELYEYVITLVDSGYRKKRVPWWKRLIAFIVFVASIVTLQPQYGYPAAIALSSTILVLVSFTFSLLGLTEWAAAFAEVNKMVEPLVLIASIYLAINNVTAFLDKVAEDSIEALIKDVVKDFVTTIVEGAKELFSGSITSTSLTFVRNMIKLVTIPQQIKLASLSERNKDLQAEYEELMEEMNRDSNILLGFTRLYSKPATADWSIYAEQFDFPYEGSRSSPSLRLSLGNIQNTTRQALRKASYNEVVFDNILII